MLAARFIADARRGLPALTAALLFGLGAAGAAERPVSGERDPAFAALDASLLRFMDRIDAAAATVAVSRAGRIVYSAGYGWRDAARKKPVAPDALMRIASISKPITAAAVRDLAAEGRLTLEAKAFALLDIRPPRGTEPDPRLAEITVGHLLNHQGGWDSTTTFDPMFRSGKIERGLGLKRPARSRDAVRFMLTQPLQFDPGTRSAYSNFGYCVLGRVIEAVTGRPYRRAIEQDLLGPLGIDDIRVGRTRKRHPREVAYPVPPDAFPLEIHDANGGLIASAPALCRFMRHYWMSGRRREPGQRQRWLFFGSLPGTTAMVSQRPDGTDVAVLLNARRDEHVEEDNAELSRVVNAALDATPDKKRGVLGGEGDDGERVPFRSR